MEQKIKSKEPIIIAGKGGFDSFIESDGAAGNSFIIYEWEGSGYDYLHVHYEDDEAFHILKGNLNFRFAGHNIEASEGTTVFVPAGVPHTYTAESNARYLIILTPRLDKLISELDTAPKEKHPEVMKKYKSEILEKI